MEIVGFVGLMGSGKSLCAARLVERYSFTRASFAQPIKDMAEVVLMRRGVQELLRERLIAGDLKETSSFLYSGASPRQVMQRLGMMFREIHPDFWVHVWRDMIVNCKKVVVDDVRFPNEADEIRRLGGVIVHVDRPGRPTLTGKVATHETEMHANTIPADWEITNGGTVEDLVGVVDAIAERVSTESAMRREMRTRVLQ